MAPLTVGLDTRRSAFACSLDLATAGALVDVLVFDVPDALRLASRISLVSHDAQFTAGLDIGFRQRDRLVGESAAPSDSPLIVAVSAARLRHAWFERASAGRPATEPLVIPFSTAVALPRGVQTFGPRQLAISALVQAPPPQITLAAQAIDVTGGGQDGSFAMARLSLALPPDLVFESSPGVAIEAVVDAGLKPHITLALDPLWATAATLHDEDSPDPRLRRWRLVCHQPAALAGQVMHLGLNLAAKGVLALVDAHLGARAAPDDAAAPMTARLATRLTGWLGAEADPDARATPRRLWRINPPDVASAVTGAHDGLAMVSLGDITAPWRPRAGEIARADGPLLRLTYDVDAPARGLTLPDLTLLVRGWPLALGASLNLTVAAEAQAQPQPLLRREMMLTPSGDGRDRAGEGLLDGASLAAALTPVVQRLAPEAGSTRLTLPVMLQAGSAELHLALGVVIEPSPRRVAMAVDLGATAIALWRAPVRSGRRQEPLVLMGLGDEGPLLPARTEVPNAATGVRATLLPPPLPGQGRRPAFRAGERPGATASLRRQASPKTALQPRRWAHHHALADTRRPADIVSDALGELMLAHMVPKSPDLRQPQDHRLPLIPQLVLTYPAGCCDETLPLWEAAAARLRQTLEPAFPGVRDTPDAVTLVAEGIAAGRYAASLDQPGLPPHRLISLDLGAVASHATVLEVGAGRIEPLVALSLPVGGDDVQAALMARVDALLDPLIAVAAGAWARLDGGSLSLRDNPARNAALDALAQAVSEAQMALSAVLPTGDPWSTPDAPPLVVTLSRFGGARPAHGVLVPLIEPAPGEGHITPGVRWRVIATGAQGEKSLQMLLWPAALQGASDAERRHQRLVNLIASTLPRLALSGIPAASLRPEYALAVTGRGALWPPLGAAIKAAGQARGDRLCAEGPLAPETMKLAVSAGAALLAAEGPSSLRHARYGPAFAIAVQALRVRDGGSGAGDRGIGTAFVTERLYYLSADARGGGRTFEAENPLQPSLSGRVNLGRRFALVKAAPGLDPDGRLIAELRDLTGGWEPLTILDGDSVIDAADVGLAAFGPCDILSAVRSDGRLHVRINALNHDWSGEWVVARDQALAGTLAPPEGRGA